MKAIYPTEWNPADGMELEDNAMHAIASVGNALIVAGPGAGKTELLAQKASYLLLTNKCPFPKKILAISFKRDAAFNLKERVKKRVGEALTRRFDSFTFDAFAKLILDRFHNGLPAPYGIHKDYEIFFSDEEIDLAFRAVNETFYATHNIKFGKWLTSSPLPINIEDTAENVRMQAWINLARGGGKTKLNFSMVMRLAALIMDTNPLLRSHLQQTYSHVFLDEFQDTTHNQYHLLKSCFDGSNVNYTAVGDDKQNIMGWAGSIKRIFDVFQSEMLAERHPLIMNFRSAPQLIKLQNHLVKELLNKTDFATPSKKWKPDQGEALVYFFQTQKEECEKLSEEIKKWMAINNNPRDICILVKMKLQDYAGELISFLRSKGISARNEDVYQDFLTEEAIIYVSGFIHLIFSEVKQGYLEQVFDILINLYPQYSDEQLLKLHLQISRFSKNTRNKFETTLDEAKIKNIIEEIFNFAGLSRFKMAFPQYKNGTWLESKIAQFTKFLVLEFVATHDIIKALNKVEGKDSIPIMTIHKSKGLEYNTVVFIGLEDKAFFSYKSQRDQDQNAFFVALSRAKERVAFTFSKIRKMKNKDELQNYREIAEIFETLRSSGIVSFIGQQ
jgi:superfamily I DNA/RNA helicase